MCEASPRAASRIALRVCWPFWAAPPRAVRRSVSIEKPFEERIERSYYFAGFHDRVMTIPPHFLGRDH
jgi:hypothetical protein